VDTGEEYADLDEVAKDRAAASAWALGHWIPPVRSS